MPIGQGYRIAAALLSCSVVLGVSRACEAQALTPRGEWSSTTQYAQDDLVVSRGSTWRARRTNRNKVPGSTVPATAEDWEQFAAGLNPLGLWSGATKYHLDDLVLHQGSTWRALRTSRRKRPDINIE